MQKPFIIKTHSKQVIKKKTLYIIVFAKTLLANFLLNCKMVKTFILTSIMRQAHPLSLLLSNILEESEKKSLKNLKRKIKQSLYLDDIIDNVQNRKEYIVYL